MPTTALATCTRCNETNENRRLIRPANREPYYMGLCTTCERAANRSRRANGGASVPRVTSTALGINRRFGVEIECNLPGGTGGAAAATIRDLLPTDWRLASDGSLGPRGAEIRSGILSGEDGLAQLRTVLDLLAANGAEIDRRCGLHVHHEVQDIGRDGIVLFVRSWAANQEFIDWLVSPSRRNNGHYCRRWSDGELAGLSRWDGRYHAPAERYRAVNVRSFPKFGTVEVRQHQGTLSFRKIEAWIRMAQGLLDSVVGRSSAHTKRTNLKEFLTRAQVDEDVVAFLLGRALQFGAPAEALGVGTGAVAA